MEKTDNISFILSSERKNAKIMIIAFKGILP